MGLAFKIYKDDELISTETFDREIIKIGRLSSAHLRLEDEKVSRIHAVVEVSAGGDVNIIDMGSSEGTFVNGEKVNKAGLKPGDEIRLGDTRIVFQDEAAEEAKEAVAAAPDDVPEDSPAETAPTTEDENALESELTAADYPSDDMDYDQAPDLGSEDEEVEQQEQEMPLHAEVAETSQEAAVAPEEDSPEYEPGDERRVALPPPRELGELDDDETVTPQNWVLEVRKLWGETVMDVRSFRSDTKQVLVGEDEKAEFFMPADLLPAKAFPIARLVGSEAMLSFNNSTGGNLTTKDGTVTSLSDLAKGSKVGRDPEYGDCKTFALPEDAIATLTFGQVGFRFKYTNKPTGFISKVSDRLDYTFLNTILLVLFVYAAMVATFHLRPKAVETSEEELYKVPDRYVQFILTRPKPAKKDLVFLEKLKGDIQAKADSAERYKGKEGKMGLRGRPNTGKRSAVKAIKPDDREIVGNRGLLAVLGAGGPQGLSTVMGGTGLGGEMEGAIGNMFGGQIGNSGGFGGLGLKGTGSGGGGMGNTIGVGRLGTRGRGGGKFGYGTGVARIRRRGERNVNISVGRPIIMGSLSMEIIRRVIRSHRDQIKYCYSKELTRHPNLRGKVSIKFTISPKGFVTQATVSSTSLKNSTVERCMTQKIRTWKFPEPKGGGIVIVNYPFILKSS
ncbi:MAG: AgmX/PglI C-terminal domain-containing protein [Deltaproteobacteria bacterium]|nr:AgmX/PglI C-terminal domain-containing protein [Deltaproteobacteria bacterium]MBW1870688.1 AgmX/PglI C-terminal domain-containing protein [Deltaproteobacteria bacterium]